MFLADRAELFEALDPVAPRPARASELLGYAGANKREAKSIVAAHTSPATVARGGVERELVACSSAPRGLRVSTGQRGNATANMWRDHADTHRRNAELVGQHAASAAR